MDFRLYARVLWRFKRVVVAGLVLAVVLAALSVLRVGPDGVAFRDSVLWSSTTRIGVTQQGFPWGRLLAGGQTPPGATARNLGIPLADPNRLTTLAVLYAELATSDPVRGLINRSGSLPLCDREAYAGTPFEAEVSRRCGSIIATPVVVGDSRVALPLVDLVAIAPSSAAAVRLAQRSADAFATYIRRQQRANNVPANDRVVVQQLVRPKPPKVYRARPKTMPIVVFLAVMFATVGLVFLLENARPRSGGVAEESEAHEAPGAQSTARRSMWA